MFYDNAGRSFKKSDNTGDTLFTCDYEDRVTQITYPDLSTNTFSYNGLGSMVGKNDSSGSDTYFRNGSVPGSGVISDSHATYTGVVSERSGGRGEF